MQYSYCFGAIIQLSYHFLGLREPMVVPYENKEMKAFVKSDNSSAQAP